MQKYHSIYRIYKNRSGILLVEILIAIGLAGILLPILIGGLIATRQGEAQQQYRTEATMLLAETQEAIRSVRDAGWSAFALNGTYHPISSSGNWSLASGADTPSVFTRSVVISDVQRDSNANIVTSGGMVDPSTKHITITITWGFPLASTITSHMYLTRHDNNAYIETTKAQFDAGTQTSTTSTNTAGGELQLADNKARWCTPAFSNATIDLPDGPPVAVDATANASVSTPNDVYVATAPYATSAAKLAYVTVTANTDPPSSSLKGTFTMDSSLYSSGTFPSGTGLDNNFKTNDVKYYTSASGKKYALLATNLTEKEVVAVQINDGTGDAYQDPVNQIYKYWTYFNTRQYNANAGVDTGFLDPSAQAADTGGDGNGFASNPTRAYSDNNSFAVDTDSGSGTSTNCTSSEKDKHRFYNYGFSLPSGATVNGVEVRLDARVDSQVGSPMMCVQLSWDGGTTWTTTKSTSTLSTTETSFILGGTADTWGRSWSSTNFSNTNFRVRVINVASNTSRDFSLDWVGVKVHYSGGASAINDQAPFGYGATTLTVLGNTGYAASGGYLYAFDLSTIDSKSPSSELDQLGCRIQLDGYDCKPGTPNASDLKYNAGETGTSWSDVGSPAHNTCADGGNIELYATNGLSAVQVSGNKYIFVAVGGGTNPEFEIVNVTNVPDNASNPTINNSSCGRISGGNSGWKMIGSKDFNTGSGTEEAANSVYAKSDGTRAYISSNGTSDSKQFYILNTTTKTAPAFLSGTSTPSTGFYQGAGAYGELYPRRSLTVLNGQRVVLVGNDGVTNSNNAEEYQVLNAETEATPTYCGGTNFDQGFNDLTSVSEADGDNFVYMVANTTLNELKIIQGGPDGQYVDSGTFESQIFDANGIVAFNRIVANSTIPGSTTLRYQIAVADQVGGSCTGATYTYLGPDGTASTYYTPSTNGTQIYLNDDGTGYENPGRCLRYKAYFATSNYNASPVLQDVSINYSP